MTDSPFAQNIRRAPVCVAFATRSTRSCSVLFGHVHPFGQLGQLGQLGQFDHPWYDGAAHQREPMPTVVT